MRSIPIAVFMLAALIPSIAPAAVVDASLLPDGTYTVKLEKVEDAQHALVMMQNGVETVLISVSASKTTRSKSRSSGAKCRFSRSNRLRSRAPDDPKPPFCKEWRLRRARVPLVSYASGGGSRHAGGRRNFRRTLVRSIISPALFALVALLPIAASAALVDPSLVPDGTYVCKVEKVEDAQHLLVLMQNGVETTLIAQGVDFSKVKANDTIKVSLMKGKVPVYTIQ
jgi:hypothetical protein